ncbi:NADP-dependent malic enzyme 3 [Blattella germanica]|nr:NADP-dependent malic enzyme 3 [Blattella germanica]
MLPAVVLSPEDQVELVKIAVDQYTSDDQKYVYLQDLQLRNERLYYRLITENMEELLPVIYTPTMKLACAQLNLVYRRPRGIFISIYDRGHCLDILKNWYEYLQNKFYFGLRQKRVSDEEEQELIDEFILAAHQRFGDKIVLHFEDFKQSMAFSIKDRYKEKCCILNGDIQIPGCLILSGLISASKVTNTAFKDNKFLFFGSGQSAIGAADLCLQQMEREGVVPQEGQKRIWMMDSHGFTINYAKDMEPMTDLLEVIKKVEPTILIEGGFTPEVLSEMAKLNARPVIFAMGNQCGNPECSIEDAIKYTEGRALFATNKLLTSVALDGRTYEVGSANNAMVFPGVILGAMLCGMKHIPDQIYIEVARVSIIYNHNLAYTTSRLQNV